MLARDSKLNFIQEPIEWRRTWKAFKKEKSRQTLLAFSNLTRPWTSSISKWKHSHSLNIFLSCFWVYGNVTNQKSVPIFRSWFDAQATKHQRAFQNCQKSKSVWHFSAKRSCQNHKTTAEDKHDFFSLGGWKLSWKYLKWIKMVQNVPKTGLKSLINCWKIVKNDQKLSTKKL